MPFRPVFLLEFCKHCMDSRWCSTDL